MNLRIFNPNRRDKPKPKPPTFAICANCQHFSGDEVTAAYDLQQCRHPSEERTPAQHPVTGDACFTDGAGFYPFPYPLADHINPSGKCSKFLPTAIDGRQ